MKKLLQKERNAHDVRVTLESIKIKTRIRWQNFLSFVHRKWWVCLCKTLSLYYEIYNKWQRQWERKAFMMKGWLGVVLYEENNYLVKQWNCILSEGSRVSPRTARLQVIIWSIEVMHEKMCIFLHKKHKVHIVTIRD